MSKKSPKTLDDLRLCHIGKRILLLGEEVNLTGMKADSSGLAIMGGRPDGSSLIKWFRWGELGTPVALMVQ